MRTSIAIVLFVAMLGCKKSEPAAPAATTTEKVAVDPDGTRHVAVEANKEGYHPDRIVGAPSEKLTLVFTRTAESDCIAQVKTPEGKLVDLPLNKPVNVAVTVPATGEVGFACGMDMFHGTVVAGPAKS